MPWRWPWTNRKPTPPSGYPPEVQDVMDRLANWDEDVEGQKPEYRTAVDLVLEAPITSRPPTVGWLGGRPHLPKDVSWPNHGKHPCQFLGQVDCSALPPELWGGRGPRRGWLCFFLGKGGDDAAKVLHIPERGPERTPPPGVIKGILEGKYLHFGKEVPERFQRWEAPRWPLRLKPREGRRIDNRGPASRLYDKERPRVVAERQLDLTAPSHRPFDWFTAELALAYADARAKRIAKARKSTGPWPDAGPELTELLKDAANAAQTEAFSATWWDQAMARLDQLVDPQRSTEEEAVSYATPATTFGSWMAPYALHLSEYASFVYAEDPTRLPDPLRSHHEALWAYDAALEQGQMGGLPTYVYPSHPLELKGHIVLLEVPSSNLLGWSIGDIDVLAFTMRPDDLARGDFSRVAHHVSN